MTNRERFLVVVSGVGFAVPNAMVIAFLVEHGLDLDGYFGDWVGTLPAAQLTADLAICCVAFITWTAWEGRRLSLRSWSWSYRRPSWSGCASVSRCSCCCASGRCVR